MSGEHEAKHEPRTWPNTNDGHARHEPSHKGKKRDAKTRKLREGTERSTADPQTVPNAAFLRTCDDERRLDSSACVLPFPPQTTNVNDGAAVGGTQQ